MKSHWLWNIAEVEECLTNSIHCEIFCLQASALEVGLFNRRFRLGICYREEKNNESRYPKIRSIAPFL